MYELYPFFTNDGSVGLYSKEDEDIYHSVYGALDEAWSKFIEPSNLQDLIKVNKDIKILDICYGIGYNTKSALQLYLNEFKKSQEKNILKVFLNKLNFKFKKSFKNKKICKKNSEKTSRLQNNIAPIDTDKIPKIKSNFYEVNFRKNFSKNEKSSNDISKYNAAIDINNKFKDKDFLKCVFAIKNSKSVAPNILIDAVDLDSTLINLSPFITCRQNRYKSNQEINNKLEYKKVIEERLANHKEKKLEKHKIISKEVFMLIIKSLIDKNHYIETENVKNILADSTKSMFFEKNGVNFARFYQNEGYKSINCQNKSTFLHNIYYRYISQSYKLIKKLTVLGFISLNFAAIDARRFILSTTNKYNLIFLDAFTPAKVPSLWTVDFLKELFRHLEDDGMIMTYTNSASVRNAFLNCGFHIGKIYNRIDNKYMGTIAVKNPELIKCPLNEKDVALINSKAGIYYKDPSLNLSNKDIINNRQIEFANSALISSTQALKGLKNG